MAAAQQTPVEGLPAVGAPHIILGLEDPCFSDLVALDVQANPQAWRITIRALASALGVTCTIEP